MHNAVPGGLAGAVLVVIVVLGLGVVHRHHGAGQDARLLPGLQPEDAGGGLLAAADEAVGIVLALAPQQVDQVPAVVNDDVGAALEGFGQVVLIFLGGGAVDAEGLYSQAGKAGSHVVLGGQRVGAGEVDLRTPLGEHIAQVGGFGLQMDGHGHPQAPEGLLLFKAGLNLRQGGHKVPDPLDFSPAGLGQGHVFHNAHNRFLFSCRLGHTQQKKAPEGNLARRTAALPYRC